MPEPIAFRVEIAPRGDAVLCAADGLYPEGYLPHGNSWALRLPPDLLGEDLKYDAATAGFGCGTEDEAAVGVVKLRGFWQGARAELLPDLLRMPPLSTAGLVRDERSMHPLVQETGRAAQIKAYQDMTRSAASTGGVPAGIALILRQVQLLHLPSRSEARIRKHAPGHWALQLDEAGSLERLLDDVLATPLANKKDGYKIAIAAPAGVKFSDPVAARFIALVRAVQLARIWEACWARDMPRVDVDVTHAGVPGKVVRLSVGPECWGLPLARLARMLTEVLDQDIPMPIWGQAASTGLKPQLISAEDATFSDEEWFDPAPARPVAWQASDAEGFPRWTYSGTGIETGGTYADLPFVLSPSTWMAMSDRLAFRDWLDRDRRAQGFQPEFARFYLQGLEYRLLAENGPPNERAEIIREMRAVAALMSADAPLTVQVHDLIDWLGAMGRRDLAALGKEGPLSVLVATSRKVADGKVLEHDDLCALAAICLKDDALRDAEFVSALRAVAPEGLRIRPPRVALMAGYRSISGLLDNGGYRFVHAGKPLADLRVSAPLLHAITRAQAIAVAPKAEG